jgi:hypothetical protein
LPSEKRVAADARPGITSHALDIGNAVEGAHAAAMLIAYEKRIRRSTTTPAQSSPADISRSIPRTSAILNAFATGQLGTKFIRISHGGNLFSDLRNSQPHFASGPRKP